jgi:hypothetical protein
MSDKPVEIVQRITVDPHSNSIKPVHSPHHAHPLQRCEKDQAWSCDGNTVFGRCKGEGRKDTGKRYKCTVCANFDLCELCV